MTKQRICTPTLINLLKLNNLDLRLTVFIPMKKITILSTFLCLSLFAALNAQNVGYDAQFGCVTDQNSLCVPNTVLTPVPFLRIVPDARAGALGDTGIALSPDANSIHFNAANLAFSEERVGLSATYTPWLRNLGLQDVYNAYLSGFRQLDDLQTVGFGFKFFSLGGIDYTDPNGNLIGSGNPREIEFAVAYARKLTSNFSAGLTAKYIFSNLATGQIVNGVEIVSGNSFAADISFNYEKETNLGANGGLWKFGLTLSNLGSKISYTGSSVRDFLPGNFGLGGSLRLDLDEYNSITFAVDINKLLVPSPISEFLRDADGNLVANPDFDENGNGIADHRELGLFSGIFGSFGDAQGGFSEELREFTTSLGVEYWYNKQFAVRAGYYREHELKGDRQFLTVGVGIKYNVFGLNLSYLAPTNNRRNPLDNTLRFGVLFDIGAARAQNAGN